MTIQRHEMTGQDIDEDQMRPKLWIAALLLPCFALTQVKSGQIASKEMFFRKDVPLNQWCAYKSETDWRTEMDPFQPETIGGVEYVSDHVSVVHVTTTDQSGDWAIYDDYSFDKNERLQSLKRTINVLPGRLSEEQVFRIQAGKAIQEKSTISELGTGKPTQFPGGDWRPTRSRSRCHDSRS